jgi:diguanylate cyclase (GGDEF)-like protein
MRVIPTNPLPFSRAEKLCFLRSKLRYLLLWPVVFGTLAAATWIWASWTIKHEKHAIAERAFNTASAQSRVYADQLDQVIRQIDFLMLSLKYQWQKTAGGIQLEEQVRLGLMPASAGLIVTIVDRHGNPVTSSATLDKAHFNISGRDYFREHKADPNRGLVFSRPMPGLRIQRPVLVLSRRLDGAGGVFNGVVVVAIEPAYLSSFADDTALKPGDFIAVLRADSVLIASRLIGAQLPQAAVFKADPLLETKAGTKKIPGDQFVDGRTRFVGWHAAKSYPVAAMVGHAEDSLLAAYQKRERELRLIASTGGALLLIIGVLGFSESSRRILTKQYAREVEATYRLATDSARDGFYMLRPLYNADRELDDFLIEDCNERGAMYRGLPRARLVGARLSTTLPVLFRSHMLPACRQAMEHGFYEDEMYVPAHGSRRAQWLQRKLVRSGMGLAVTLRDISDIKAHEEEMVRLANADPVTFLPNRHWLMSALPAALERARAGHGLLAVLFVDLDDFKNFNDTLGHATGDELLRAAALRFRDLVCASDSIARLGGDEFTIVLESARTEDEVRVVAERILAALRDPVVLADGSRHAVQASIGISLFPRDGDDGVTLLKHADIAMYAAKAAGKGTYHFFQASLSERLVTRLTRLAELRHAIEVDQMELYYQPRVCGDSGEMCSMEALVRWRHPLRGLISPDDFIPLAEEHGLIGALGELVIAKACAQLAQWRAENLPVTPLSINVSARQIDKGCVSAFLGACMAKYGIDTTQIEVEITESGTVGKEAAACAELAAVRALGVKLYVDDFGTGYSSLSQLKELDMDGLKVDQSFTARLANGPEDLAFFTAIVSMAHAIGVRVVAEGVETAEQLRILQQLHCDEIQGYYISAPVSAADAALLLQKRFLFPRAA